MPRRFVVLVLLACLASAPGASVLAATAGETGASLPGGRYGAAAAWAAGALYVIGGYPCAPPSYYCDDILRYDPATNEVTLVGHLPMPRQYAAAVTVDDRILVIGGDGPTCCGGKTEVFEFDPATGETRFLAHLARPTSQMGAVWTGTHVFVLGGVEPSIQRLDPFTGQVELRTARVPYPSYGTSAVWTGEELYVLGVDHGRLTVRYDVQNDSVESWPSGLPTNTFHAPAFWDGAYAFLLAPHASGTQIWKYDLATRQGTLMAASFGVPAKVAGGAWNGREAFLAGGYDAGGQPVAAIQRFDPTPGAPSGLQAAAGPGSGRVTLSWDPPAADNASRVLEYHVFRRNATGAWEEVGRVPGARTSFVEEWLGYGEPVEYAVAASSLAGQVGPRSVAASTRSGDWAERDVLRLDDVELHGEATAEAVPLPPTGVPPVATPDHGGTDAVPVQDVPPTGPVVTPPAHVGVATLVVRDDEGGRTCLDLRLDAADGEVHPLACVRPGLVPAALPRGEVPLVTLDPADVPATPGQETPDVPATPPQDVPDVEGVEEGEGGETPARREPRRTMDVRAWARYDDGAALDGGYLATLGRDADAFAPFDALDPRARAWLVEDAAGAVLTVEVVLREDGVPVQTGRVALPWLGQALAAAWRTAG